MQCMIKNTREREINNENVSVNQLKDAEGERVVNKRI